jgi:hypothetical protein
MVLKCGGCLPMLLVFGATEATHLLLEDFPNDHEEKIRFLMGAGVFLKHKHDLGTLSKVFLVMEAWMGKNSNILPSQDPKRMEVLVVGSLDVATKEQTVATFEYIRDAEGILREMKEVVLPDGTRIAQAESPLLPAFVAGYTNTW